MPGFNIDQKDSVLLITFGSHPVLNYHFGRQPSPTGEDPLLSRSGFIHPIVTPAGDTLTQIQPPDHLHHYGLWNPWTHVLYQGDTLDFWNLKKGQGTVRFAGFLDRQVSDTSCSFRVRHEHVILKSGHATNVPLIETQQVTVQKERDAYVIDFDIIYRVNGPEPFRLLRYRYGGFTWRVTGAWEQNNCQVLTSEGKTRNNADSTRAEWFFIQGPLSHGNGGMLVMSHPDNFNQPQPLRLWPEQDNPPSGLMANFTPTRTTDWVLESGKEYELRYLLVVYSGMLTAREADGWWRDLVE